jgi:hypothetical protein
VGIRSKIEIALSETAERLSPGSGDRAVRHAKNDLVTIDGTSENLNARYANSDVVVATSGVFEAKHVDGDPVAITKGHEGLVIAFSDSFIFIRGMGFGAREIKALGKGDVSVEKITTTLDGADVPGLRIKGRVGKPHFAVAITVPKEACDPSAQLAVRDALYDALT